MPDLRRIMRYCSADPCCRMLVQMAQDAVEPLYLVGGAVRDMVLGRPLRDWDFAGTGAMELAASFANVNATGVVVDRCGRPPRGPADCTRRRLG